MLNCLTSERRDGVPAARTAPQPHDRFAGAVANPLARSGARSGARRRCAAGYVDHILKAKKASRPFGAHAERP